MLLIEIRMMDATQRDPIPLTIVNSNRFNSIQLDFDLVRPNELGAINAR